MMLDMLKFALFWTQLILRKRMGGQEPNDSETTHSTQS